MDEDKPLDGIGFFKRALFCAFLIIAAGALSVLVLSLERRAPPIPQATFIAAHTQLSHPLGFAASVRQCADPRPLDQGCDEPRYYITKASREAK